MSHGITVPRKHLHSIQSFCENNNLQYDFWNLMSIDQDGEADLVFTNQEEKDKALTFLRRLIQLDNLDS